MSVVLFTIVNFMGYILETLKKEQEQGYYLN